MAFWRTSVWLGFTKLGSLKNCIGTSVVVVLQNTSKSMRFTEMVGSVNLKKWVVIDKFKLRFWKVIFY